MAAITSPDINTLLILFTYIVHVRRLIIVTWIYVHLSLNVGPFTSLLTSLMAEYSISHGHTRTTGTATFPAALRPTITTSHNTP